MRSAACDIVVWKRTVRSRGLAITREMRTGSSRRRKRDLATISPAMIYRAVLLIFCLFISPGAGSANWQFAPLPNHNHSEELRRMDDWRDRRPQRVEK